MLVSGMAPVRAENAGQQDIVSSRYPFLASGALTPPREGCGTARRVAQPPLTVPTVLDPVIQQALAQVLTPLFDPGFSAHSYGFREGHHARQAVRAVEAWATGTPLRSGL